MSDPRFIFFIYGCLATWSIFIFSIIGFWLVIDYQQRKLEERARSMMQ